MLLSLEQFVTFVALVVEIALELSLAAQFWAEELVLVAGPAAAKKVVVVE